MENDNDQIQMLLLERALDHGSYNETARISQLLKIVMHTAEGWKRLPYEQQEALDMDAVKTARILSGNNNLAEHWRDKEGYSRLARNNLKSTDEIEDDISKIARKYAPRQQAEG
jgi:hypothetical protein